MVLDLKRCIGCYSCTIACKQDNATPPGMSHAPVYQTEVGRYPKAKRIFIPVLCNHCKDPPCVKACPTGAMHKRADGIVLVDQDRCCGVRSCVLACPYGAIQFYDSPVGYFKEGLTPYEEIAYAKYQKRTVRKCDLCADRIDQSLDPSCVLACPTNCRIFGDLDDKDSNPSKLLKERGGGKALLAEAGTNPSVLYVA